MSKEKALSLLYLGFDESANPTEKEIQEAYKKVAKVFHPDGGGSNEQFRELTIARDILLQEAPVKKKKKEQPMPQQNYYNEREHINRLNTQILEELGEVLHKLPEQVFYIFFKLHGAKASVKVHKRTFTNIELEGVIDQISARIELLGMLKFMNENSKQWRHFHAAGMKVCVHSPFSWYFMRLLAKLPGVG